MLSNFRSTNFAIFATVLVSFCFYSVSCRCECLHKIVLLHSNEDIRIISSPEYPRSYCPNLDCMWRIVAPDNITKIFFYADNLDLRENDDRIIFYDHTFLTEIDNETESQSCTGDEICRFASSGQYMTIRFLTSAGLIDNYGFQGFVSTRDKPIYALLAAIQTYCVPISVIFAILLGLFVSIACCKRNKPRQSRIFRHHQQQPETANIDVDSELPHRSPYPRQYRNYNPRHNPNIRQSI